MDGSGSTKDWDWAELAHPLAMATELEDAGEKVLPLPNAVDWALEKRPFAIAVDCTFALPMATAPALPIPPFVPTAVAWALACPGPVPHKDGIKGVMAMAPATPNPTV